MAPYKSPLNQRLQTDADAMAPKVDPKAKAKAAGKAAARKMSQAKIQKPGVSATSREFLKVFVKGMCGCSS